MMEFDDYLQRAAAEGRCGLFVLHRTFSLPTVGEPRLYTLATPVAELAHELRHLHPNSPAWRLGDCRYLAVRLPANLDDRTYLVVDDPALGDHGLPLQLGSEPPGAVLRLLGARIGFVWEADDVREWLAPWPKVRTDVPELDPSLRAVLAQELERQRGGGRRGSRPGPRRPSHPTRGRKE